MAWLRPEKRVMGEGMAMRSVKRLPLEFDIARRAIPHIVARGGGNIVNIATDHICPPPGFATGGGTRMDIYDSSKWGINGLTGAWSKFLAPARRAGECVVHGRYGFRDDSLCGPGCAA